MIAHSCQLVKIMEVVMEFRMTLMHLKGEKMQQRQELDW